MLCWDGGESCASAGEKRRLRAYEGEKGGEGSGTSVSSWNDDNENSSDVVDNDDFDDDDDDDNGADGDPLTELFESWWQKSRFLKGLERRWEG